MRLRQIALVASELRPVERAICDQLGLEVCYRDPGLSHFGLRHGLYAIGDRLLEVVVPKRDGTTAGRYLERRGGDGGYMVILQTDDVQREKARIESADFRIVHEGGTQGDGEEIHGIHLHPKDTGGAILSIDEANPVASWGWAGHDWQYHSLDGVVTDLVAVDIQADDPDAVGERWARAVDREVTNGVMTLDDAEIRFVAATDGRGDGLAAADLVATDRKRAGETLVLCGTRFNLV